MEWDARKEQTSSAPAGRKRKRKGLAKNRQTAVAKFVARIYTLVNCRGDYVKVGSNLSKVFISRGVRMRSNKKLKGLVSTQGSSSVCPQQESAAGSQECSSEAQENIYSDVPGRCQGEYASTYYPDVVAKSVTVHLGECGTKQIAVRRVKRAELLKRLVFRWQHHHKKREVSCSS